MRFLIPFLLLSSPLLAFDLDVMREEYQRLRHPIIVSDLKVGDTARIDVEYICIEGNRFFIDPLGPVLEEQSANWNAKALPGGKMSVWIEGRDKDLDFDELVREVHALIDNLRCNAYRDFYLSSDRPFLEVISINGATSLSELFFPKEVE